jgi:hypothetical protein
MSTYEEDSAVDAARIDTVARARRLWRRTGKTTDDREDADFFKDETPRPSATEPHGPARSTVHASVKLRAVSHGGLGPRGELLDERGVCLLENVVWSLRCQDWDAYPEDDAGSGGEAGFVDHRHVHDVARTHLPEHRGVAQNGLGHVVRYEDGPRPGRLERLRSTTTVGQRTGGCLGERSIWTARLATHRASLSGRTASRQTHAHSAA